MNLALLLVIGSHDARILGVFPYPSKSHVITPRVLMLELAGRGHHVTEVTPFLESKIIPNYTEIEVKADVANSTGGNGKRTRSRNCKILLGVSSLLSIASDVDFVFGDSLNPGLVPWGLCDPSPL